MSEKIAPKFYLSKVRVINSFKIALACLLGLVIANIFHLNMPQWVLITIVVIMGSNIRIGGAIKKSYLRLGGTLLGAIVSSLILILLENYPLAINLALLIMVMIFGYLASAPSDSGQAGLLGAVTIVMVLSGHNPTFQVAINRVVEIALGVLIAVAVTWLVFPLHAKKIFYENLSQTISKLKQIYDLLTTVGGVEQHEKYEQLEIDVIQNMAKQHALVNEVLSEDYKFKYKQHLYRKILTSERKLLRSNYILSQALTNNDAKDLLIDPKFIEINQAINQLFTEVENISKLQADTLPLASDLPNPNNIILEIENYSESFQKHAIINVEALLFCLKHVVTVLVELIEILPQFYKNKNSN